VEDDDDDAAGASLLQTSAGQNRLIEEEWFRLEEAICVANGDRLVGGEAISRQGVSRASSEKDYECGNREAFLLLASARTGYSAWCCTNAAWEPPDCILSYQ
jgi:hypothetical protein